MSSIQPYWIMCWLLIDTLDTLYYTKKNLNLLFCLMPLSPNTLSHKDQECAKLHFYLQQHLLFVKLGSSRRVSTEANKSTVTVVNSCFLDHLRLRADAWTFGDPQTLSKCPWRVGDHCRCNQHRWTGTFGVHTSYRWGYQVDWFGGWTRRWWIHRHPDRSQMSPRWKNQIWRWKTHHRLLLPWCPEDISWILCSQKTNDDNYWLYISHIHHLAGSFELTHCRVSLASWCWMQHHPVLPGKRSHWFLQRGRGQIKQAGREHDWG